MYIHNLLHSYFAMSYILSTNHKTNCICRTLRDPNSAPHVPLSCSVSKAENVTEILVGYRQKVNLNSKYKFTYAM